MKTLSDFYGSKMILFKLIGLSGFFGLGHHLDHVVRGNHVGWPISPEVTAFTYSLFIYPLILIGLYLEYKGRETSIYWPLVLIPIFGLVLVTHFGPWALEPPSHVIDPYSSFYLGLFAFAWLVALTLCLALALIQSLTVFQNSRNRE